MRMKWWLLPGLILLLGGCAQQPIQRDGKSAVVRPFRLANVVKSEIDMVADLTQGEVLSRLRLIADKLYRRNPREFRKAGLPTTEAASARLFDQIRHWERAPMARASWQHNFSYAFDPDYPGDRVEVFMSALTVMIMASYNHRKEFFMTDELDAQKLYNSARNIEVAVWKLGQARLPDGSPFLLANSCEGEAVNLSFEREFGKLIAQQDLLALIMEDRTNRVITRVIQSTASFVFLPI